MASAFNVFPPWEPPPKRPPPVRRSSCFWTPKAKPKDHRVAEDGGERTCMTADKNKSGKSRDKREHRRGAHKCLENQAARKEKNQKKTRRISLEDISSMKEPLPSEEALRLARDAARAARAELRQAKKESQKVHRRFESLKEKAVAVTHLKHHDGEWWMKKEQDFGQITEDQRKLAAMLQEPSTWTEKFNRRKHSGMVPGSDNPLAQESSTHSNRSGDGSSYTSSYGPSSDSTNSSSTSFSKSILASMGCSPTDKGARLSASAALTGKTRQKTSPLPQAKHSPSSAGESDSSARIRSIFHRKGRVTARWTAPLVQDALETARVKTSTRPRSLDGGVLFPIYPAPEKVVRRQDVSQATSASSFFPSDWVGSSADGYCTSLSEFSQGSVHDQMGKYERSERSDLPTSPGKPAAASTMRHDSPPVLAVSTTAISGGMTKQHTSHPYHSVSEIVHDGGAPSRPSAMVTTRPVPPIPDESSLNEDEKVSFPAACPAHEEEVIQDDIESGIGSNSHRESCAGVPGDPPVTRMCRPTVSGSSAQVKEKSAGTGGLASQAYSRAAGLPFSRAHTRTASPCPHHRDTNQKVNARTRKLHSSSSKKPSLPKSSSPRKQNRTSRFSRVADEFTNPSDDDVTGLPMDEKDEGSRGPRNHVTGVNTVAAPFTFSDRSISRSAVASPRAVHTPSVADMVPLYQPSPAIRKAVTSSSSAIQSDNAPTLSQDIASCDSGDSVGSLWLPRPSSFVNSDSASASNRGNDTGAASAPLRSAPARTLAIALGKITGLTDTGGEERKDGKQKGLMLQSSESLCAALDGDPSFRARGRESVASERRSFPSPYQNRSSERSSEDKRRKSSAWSSSSGSARVSDLLFSPASPKVSPRSGSYVEKVSAASSMHDRESMPRISPSSAEAVHEDPSLVQKVSILFADKKATAAEQRTSRGEGEMVHCVASAGSAFQDLDVESEGEPVLPSPSLSPMSSPISNHTAVKAVSSGEDREHEVVVSTPPRSYCVCRTRGEIASRLPMGTTWNGARRSKAFTLDGDGGDMTATIQSPPSSPTLSPQALGPLIHEANLLSTGDIARNMFGSLEPSAFLDTYVEDINEAQEKFAPAGPAPRGSEDTAAGSSGLITKVDQRSKGKEMEVSASPPSSSGELSAVPSHGQSEMLTDHSTTEHQTASAVEANGPLSESRSTHPPAVERIIHGRNPAEFEVRTNTYDEDLREAEERYERSHAAIASGHERSISSASQSYAGAERRTSLTPVIGGVESSRQGMPTVLSPSSIGRHGRSTNSCSQALPSSPSVGDNTDGDTYDAGMISVARGNIKRRSLSDRGDCGPDGPDSFHVLEPTPTEHAGRGGASTSDSACSIAVEPASSSIAEFSPSSRPPSSTPSHDLEGARCYDEYSCSDSISSVECRSEIVSNAVVVKPDLASRTSSFDAAKSSKVLHREHTTPEHLADAFPSMLTPTSDNGVTSCGGEPLVESMEVMVSDRPPFEAQTTGSSRARISAMRNRLAARAAARTDHAVAPRPSSAEAQESDDSRWRSRLSPASSARPELRDATARLRQHMDGHRRARASPMSRVLDCVSAKELTPAKDPVATSVASPTPEVAAELNPYEITESIIESGQRSGTSCCPSPSAAACDDVKSEPDQGFEKGFTRAPAPPQQSCVARSSGSAASTSYQPSVCPSSFLVRSDTRPDRPASVDGMVRETKEGPQLLRTTSDPGCCMRQRVGSEVLPMVHTMMKAEDPHAGEVELRLVPTSPSNENDNPGSELTGSAHGFETDHAAQEAPLLQAFIPCASCSSADACADVVNLMKEPLNMSTRKDIIEKPAILPRAVERASSAGVEETTRREHARENHQQGRSTKKNNDDLVGRDNLSSSMHARLDSISDPEEQVGVTERNQDCVHVGTFTRINTADAAVEAKIEDPERAKMVTLLAHNEAAREAAESHVTSRIAAAEAKADQAKEDLVLALSSWHEERALHDKKVVALRDGARHAIERSAKLEKERNGLLKLAEETAAKAITKASKLEEDIAQLRTRNAELEAVVAQSEIAANERQAMAAQEVNRFAILEENLAATTRCRDDAIDEGSRLRLEMKELCVRLERDHCAEKLQHEVELQAARALSTMLEGEAVTLQEQHGAEIASARARQSVLDSELVTRDNKLEETRVREAGLVAEMSVLRAHHNATIEEISAHRVALTEAAGERARERKEACVRESVPCEMLNTVTDVYKMKLEDAAGARYALSEQMVALRVRHQEELDAVTSRVRALETDLKTSSNELPDAFQYQTMMESNDTEHQRKHFAEHQEEHPTDKGFFKRELAEALRHSAQLDAQLSESQSQFELTQEAIATTRETADELVSTANRKVAEAVAKLASSERARLADRAAASTTYAKLEKEQSASLVDVHERLLACESARTIEQDSANAFLAEAEARTALVSKELIAVREAWTNERQVAADRSSRVAEDFATKSAQHEEHMKAIQKDVDERQAIWQAGSLKLKNLLARAKNSLTTEQVRSAQLAHQLGSLSQEMDIMKEHQTGSDSNDQYALQVQVDVLNARLRSQEDARKAQRARATRDLHAAQEKVLRLEKAVERKNADAVAMEVDAVETARLHAAKDKKSRTHTSILRRELREAKNILKEQTLARDAETAAANRRIAYLNDVLRRASCLEREERSVVESRVMTEASTFSEDSFHRARKNAKNDDRPKGSRTHVVEDAMHSTHDESHVVANDLGMAMPSARLAVGRTTTSSPTNQVGVPSRRDLFTGVTRAPDSRLPSEGHVIDSVHTPLDDDVSTASALAAISKAEKMYYKAKRSRGRITERREQMGFAKSSTSRQCRERHERTRARAWKRSSETSLAGDEQHEHSGSVDMVEHIHVEIASFQRKECDVRRRPEAATESSTSGHPDASLLATHILNECGESEEALDVAEQRWAMSSSRRLSASPASDYTAQAAGSYEASSLSAQSPSSSGRSQAINSECTERPLSTTKTEGKLPPARVQDEDHTSSSSPVYSLGLPSPGLAPRERATDMTSSTSSDSKTRQELARKQSTTTSSAPSLLFRGEEARDGGAPATSDSFRHLAPSSHLRLRRSKDERMLQRADGFLSGVQAGAAAAQQYLRGSPRGSEKSADEADVLHRDRFNPRRRIGGRCPQGTFPRQVTSRSTSATSSGARPRFRF